ncbi:hypothetical protein WKI27_00715 [Brevundimonas vesicularis]|uniref:hypothetical protein n=1 Tax=Brevundimonas vesicularis TaxID=41276 RepID=UPI0030BADA79
MFPNAGIMAAGVLTGPTRDEFIAHITARAVDGSRSASANLSMEGAPKTAYKITSIPINPVSGFLRGSPWGVGYYADGSFSNLAGVMLHSAPSRAAYVSSFDSATPVYLEVRGETDYYPGYAAVNRNGYFSAAIDAGVAMACWVFEMIYWDGDQAMRMKPFDQSGPTPYTW